jgi:hypothetical protein
MFNQQEAGKKSPTKDEVKQLNDELDLQLEQDKGIHQRFAAVLDHFDANPNLSFLQPHLTNDEDIVKDDKVPGKWIRFKSHSPEIREEGRPSLFTDKPPFQPSWMRPSDTQQSLQYSNPTSLGENTYDDDDEEEYKQERTTGNGLADDIIFEIKRNAELLLLMSQRQRDIQEKLAIAYEQSDRDGVENPKIRTFTDQLNDLIIPIQVIAVTLGGLRNNLKAVVENGINRTLVAEPNHDSNNNNNAHEVTRLNTRLGRFVTEKK